MNIDTTSTPSTSEPQPALFERTKFYSRPEITRRTGIGRRRLERLVEAGLLKPLGGGALGCNLFLGASLNRVLGPND